MADKQTLTRRDADELTHMLAAHVQQACMLAVLNQFDTGRLR